MCAQFLGEISVSYQGQSEGCLPEILAIEGKHRMPREIRPLGLIELNSRFPSVVAQVTQLFHLFSLLSLPSVPHPCRPRRKILRPVSRPSVSDTGYLDPGSPCLLWAIS